MDAKQSPQRARGQVGIHVPMAGESVSRAVGETLIATAPSLDVGPKFCLPRHLDA